MTNDNRVSATLDAAAITAIQGALQTIRTQLPFLIELPDAERQSIPKLGEKTVGFDEKCLAYIGTNPEFLPGFIDPAEVDKDRALRSQMQQFYPDLKTLFDQISDTLLVVGSEIYMADLAYYQAVREAARRARPGAEVVYKDLATRFPGNAKKPATPNPA